MMIHGFRCLVTVVVLTYPVASFAAYTDCASATNAGFNIAFNLSASAYETLAGDARYCDFVDLAADAVAGIVGTKELRTSDSDAVKACYFTGILAGYLQRTAAEFTECGRGPFVPDNVLGLSAGAVLSALPGSFQSLSGAEIDQVFSTPFDNTIPAEYANIEAWDVEWIPGSGGRPGFYRGVSHACAEAVDEQLARTNSTLPRWQVNRAKVNVCAVTLGS